MPKRKEVEKEKGKKGKKEEKKEKGKKGKKEEKKEEEMEEEMAGVDGAYIKLV